MEMNERDVGGCRGSWLSGDLVLQCEAPLDCCLEGAWLPRRTMRLVRVRRKLWKEVMSAQWGIPGYAAWRGRGEGQGDWALPLTLGVVGFLQPFLPSRLSS